jgi:hypothetical protein
MLPSPSVDNIDNVTMLSATKKQSPLLRLPTKLGNMLYQYALDIVTVE